MVKEKVSYVWQTQTLDPKAKVIQCAVQDPLKDFRRDPSGFYVLIRPDFADLNIHVAVCNKDHAIVAVFKGRAAQDVYAGVFRHEQKNGLNWFKSKEHVAYLGKELKKAEIALSLGQNNYFQE